jgi:hypothetical protein
VSALGVHRGKLTRVDVALVREDHVALREADVEAARRDALDIGLLLAADDDVRRPDGVELFEQGLEVVELNVFRRKRELGRRLERRRQVGAQVQVARPPL